MSQPVGNIQQRKRTVKTKPNIKKKVAPPDPRIVKLNRKFQFQKINIEEQTRQRSRVRHAIWSSISDAKNAKRSQMKLKMRRMHRTKADR